MILSDRTIKKRLKNDLKIEPITEIQIQPASVDLTLGDEFLEITGSYIDLDKEIIYQKKKGTCILAPHSFILATTKEWVEIPENLIGRLEGRSSIGRAGLFIHNAGYIDPGFKGEITLELYNASSLPIILKPGKRICQIILETVTMGSRYNGKYQGQRGVTGSRSHQDDE